MFGTSDNISNSVYSHKARSPKTVFDPESYLQASQIKAEMASGSNILLAFFEGSGTDKKGRTLSEMLQWSDMKLEDTHDFIQTMFPLPEGSLFNCNASLVDKQVFDAFRSRPDLQINLRKAFHRLLSFWGFYIEEKDSIPHITLDVGFRSVANWIRNTNHNHLRMTRVIRSLRVLGLEEEAVAFTRALCESDFLKTRVSYISRMFWTRAAYRPLNIAPDVTLTGDGKSLGPEFLRNYEASKNSDCKERATDPGC